MKIQDIKELLEKGISLRTIHELHGNTISCPMDRNGMTEEEIKQFDIDNGQGKFLIK